MSDAIAEIDATKRFFVKYYPDRGDLEKKEILEFWTAKELLSWMSKHQGESFAVFIAESVYDV